MHPIRRLKHDETVPFQAVVGGERFGPFENHAAAQGWEDIVTRRRDLSIASAREIFEGSIGGDAVYDVDAFALEFGMHPFREVHDIAIDHDNGQVPLFFDRGTRFLPREAILLVQGATKSEPTRRLAWPEELPRRVSLGEMAAETGIKAKHPAGGQLLVVESSRKYSPRYLTVWRRDTRMRTDLRVVSGHSTLEFASERLGEAAELFVPSQDELAGRKVVRMRDYQRSKVYALEGRISQEYGHRRRYFPSIEECAAFIAGVYEESDLGAPPPVKLGRPDLDHCYFKRGVGIVFSHYGLSAWTALHEAAHHVASQLAREPGHGPTFVSTLLGMLASYEGFDLDRMVELAREDGVDFNPDVIEIWRAKLDARVSAAPSP